MFIAVLLFCRTAPPTRWLCSRQQSTRQPGSPPTYAVPTPFVYRDYRLFLIVCHQPFFFNVIYFPSVQAINIISWACGSITVTFTVLGSNAALIAAAVQSILTSAAHGGALYVLLGGVTYAGIGTLPTTYYPLPYCYYNGQSYCGTTSISHISYAHLHHPPDQRDVTLC
jgi:hypothetical protein